MIQKKLVLLLVLMLLMFASAAGLFAAPDVLVDLRLYEGARERGKEKTSVITSYHLKAISSAGKILDVDLSGEKAELEKIFNLEGIKLMTQVKWGWGRDLTDKQFQLVVLNGHKFIIHLTLMEKSDHFKLEVMEKGSEKEKKDLETILIIPQGKTTVFGFEDAAGKPYFLSCQRHPDTKGDPDEPVKVPPIKKPLLIRKIKPIYPKEALRAGVSGTVTLDVITGVYGRVADITRVEGHPLLHKAALETVGKWVYEPFILHGKPYKATFTVVISFSLNKGKDEGKVEIEPVKVDQKGKPKLIKKVAPKYPEEALKAKVGGVVILEAVTGIDGSVKNILKIKGHPLLTKAAEDALRQWKYEPYIINGKPREVRFTVSVNFNLAKKRAVPAAHEGPGKSISE
ncbi:MAG: energy transducer TonB [Candidatus Aminicenantes bacterium]|nr:energy transducer TonB [Candidatus Aminicenantes bacterium]